MREREVEAYLCRGVKASGGEVRKVKWAGRRGAPDRLVLLYRHGRAAFVELKKPKGGLLETHQVREHARLRRAGFLVYVAWTKDDVDVVLQDIRSR